METPQKSQTIFSVESDIPKAIVNLLRSTHEKTHDAKQSEIAISSPQFTNKVLSDALIEAHKKGVNVAVYIGKSSSENKAIQEMRAAGIAIHNANHGGVQSHGKVAVWKYTDISGNVKHRISYGSANATNFCYQNQEHKKFMPIDEDEYAKAQRWLQGETIQNSSVTPKKFSFINPDQGYLLDRLSPRKFKEGGEVYLNTFTYNDPKLSKRLSELSKNGVRVTLTLDEKIANQPVTASQLVDMKKFGVDVRAYKKRGESVFIGKKY